MRSQKLFWGIVSVIFFVFCLQGAALFSRSFFKESGICNADGPFGVPITPAIFLGVVVGSAIFFLRAWWMESNFQRSLVWIILFAAGLSNVLERWYFGCVFDFFTFPLVPLFNVADVILTLGVVFLICWELFRGK